MSRQTPGRMTVGVIEAVGLVTVGAVMALMRGSVADGPLLRGSLAGVVIGAVAGWVVAGRTVPVVARPVIGVLGLAGSLIAAGADLSAPVNVWESLLTFLSVGLPAEGVPGLAMVPCLVAYPLSFWASSALRRGSPALFGTSVLGAVVAIETLAGYAGEWTTVLPVVVFGTLVVFALEARLSVSNLPILVGSTTEVRRQYSLLRACLQIAPLVVVALTAQAFVGRSTLYDLRSLVGERGILVEDPNPLSQVTALRNARPESVVETVRVDWDGESPGRLRSAVLNEYDGTSWRQTSLYSLTGSRLAPDPVIGGVTEPAVDGATGVDPIAVSVRVLADDDFAALPSIGYPLSARFDGLLRYSARDGLVIADSASGTSPTLDLEVLAVPSVADLIGLGLIGPGIVESGFGASAVPSELSECVDSEGVANIAGSFRRQYPDSVELASQLLAWLKLKRVFVGSGADAVGGQSLAGVEAFLSADNPDAYRKGNIDSFVSAYALVLRCAGVPNRVVVGYQLPVTAPAGGVTLRSNEITAWVEVPVPGRGWVAFDPIPTPAEIRAQIDSLRLPEPEPQAPPESPVDPDPVAPNVPVAPDRPVDRTVIAVVVTALSAGLISSWMFGVPWFIRRRRGRVQSPSTAVLMAWDHVASNLVDRGVPLSASHTPSEVVRVSAGRVPGSTVAAMSAMVPGVDTARYAAELVTSEAAGTAWFHASQAVKAMPRRMWVPRSTVTHPVVWFSRLRAVRSIPTGNHAWRADSSAVPGATADLPADGVPGVSIAGRIGDGSTGTVYRGVVNDTSMPVAVKVFRFGPGDDGFSPERFDWERKVAAMVSGRPHLPVVFDSGFTSPGNRPYIVSSLYERGTLLDRVRRDGPLSVPEGMALAIDVAVALETLHQMGVVHADVKPENVFVSTEGWVLGDLGSAWLRTSRGPAASLTPPYAAPEVWRGSSPSVSSDLYSLALTLLYAVTGQVPIAGNPPDFGLVRELFPDRHVLVESLDADPRRRPSGAREFAGGLVEVESGGVHRAFEGLSLPTPTIVKRR